MPLCQMSVAIQQELVAQMPGGVAVAGRSTLGQRSWASAHGPALMDQRSWSGVAPGVRPPAFNPSTSQAVNHARPARWKISVLNWFAPYLAIPRAQGGAHEL